MKTLRRKSHILVKAGGVLLLVVVLLGLGACRPVEEAPMAPAEQEIDSPVAAATAFYEWYLSYQNPVEGRNALVDFAYRESGYLSAGWIAAVDAQLEQMREEYGGAGSDPFLIAQDLPRAFTVEAWEVAAGEACVVVHQQFGESIHDLTVDLVVEDGAWKIDGIRPGSPLTPDGVTELFLSDYLEQARASLKEGTQGMLQSGAYRENELLSPAFIAQVDEIVASFDRGGYDPFLLAQDLPHAIVVGEPVVEGDTATVQVDRYYAGGREPVYMTVELARENGRWMIAAIRPVAETAGAEGMSPEEVVEAFYTAWREMTLAAIAGDGESPLASQAYHDSIYLAPAFVEAVDAIVAGFDRGGYDPFLCAQDVPGQLAVEGVIHTTSGARVPVRSDFANHAFVVELEQGEEGVWQIANVRCGGKPENNAAIFYTWYLAYTRNCCVLGATDPGQMRNPLVDGAYKEAPFINPAFAAQVEAELERMRANGGIGHDPILQAQAFPPDFSATAGESEGMVIVDMAFANPHRLEVRMAQVDGQWLVSGVRRLDEAEATEPAAAGPDTGA